MDAGNAASSQSSHNDRGQRHCSWSGWSIVAEGKLWLNVPSSGEPEERCLLVSDYRAAVLIYLNSADLFVEGRFRRSQLLISEMIPRHSC